MTIVCLLIFISSGYSEQNYSFINYSTREGLSQNYVNSIFMDSRGYVWICTNFGLNKFNGNKFQKYNSDGTTSTIDNDIVQNIVEGKDGILWVLTENKINKFDYIKNKFKFYPINATSIIAYKNGSIWATSKRGLELYNEKTDQFNLFDSAFVNCTLEDKDDKNNLYLLCRNILLIYNTKSKRCSTYIIPVIQHLVDKRNSLYVDSKYNVWIATPTNGCYKLDGKTHQFSTINNKKLNQLVSGECGDISGNREYLYFATAFNGLIAYNTLKNSVSEVSVETNPKSKIIQNNLNHIYVDKFGGLWLGTADYGVEYMSPYANSFEFYNGNQSSGTFKTIGQFEEYGDEIFIGSEKGLLHKNNFSTKIETILISFQANPGAKSFKAGKFIKKENETQLWMSYYNNGLHLSDLKKKKVVLSIYDDKFYFVKNIVKDSKNRNWILSRTDFGLIDAAEKRIRTDNAVERVIKKTPLNFYTMVVGDDQCIYIGSKERGILKYYPEGDSCVNFNTKNTKWIKHNFISALYIDSKKNLWVGTYGGGICRYSPSTREYKNYDINSGLINNCISGITEDKNHTIWCSSINGISSINPNDKIKNFSQKNGYPINQASPQSIKCLSNNQIIVGGNNGFCIFSPSEFKTNNIIPQLEFSKISIQGEEKEEGKINAAIRDNSKTEYNITIRHNSFPIEIEYSTIAFAYPEANKYAYKLKGVSNDWIDIGNKKSFTIYALNSGKYTFTVKACNNDEVWNETGISLNIHVEPPFWLTWFAFLLYMLIIFGIITIYLRYYKIKLNLENDIKIKQLEKSKIEQFYEKKLVLFTNFSHELRTPLTLISGPIDQLLKEPDHNKRNKYLLNLIKSNSDRLLIFVNQLMDLRKMETGNYRLKKGTYNFITFATKVITDFSNLAESRGIQLELETKEADINFTFDKQLLESVFFNLLSNAFKFTPQNGRITIKMALVSFNTLSEDTKTRLRLRSLNHDQYVEISVSDTGKGIEPEHLEQVFNRFYQTEEGSANLTNSKGTGVGLHLSNQIINLHDGIIFAQSNKPNGTTFKIYIPFVQEIELSDIILETNPALPAIEPDYIDLPENKNQKSSFTILVVEDNPEIRQYICQHLSNYYKVIEAENGQEALDIILNKNISLVISDVMMPIMDGLELCKKIKNNIEINDIPIILLTARTADEHIIQGYEMNADDYISKPFNMDILLARVKNILHKNILIRQKYSTHINVENKDTEALSLDEKFLQKVYLLINKNIEESTFELEDICKEIGISKVHLNRKIKSLTGLTPAKLILKIRLNKAQQLIARGERSITELAYTCGFADANYFSRCFKQEFKVTPSEYFKMTMEKDK